MILYLDNHLEYFISAICSVRYVNASINKRFRVRAFLRINSAYSAGLFTFQPDITHW